MRKIVVIFISLLFLVNSTIISAALAAQVTPGVNPAVVTEKSAYEILQFTSGGHVIGFHQDRVYIAGMGYALIEEFINANAVIPRHETLTGEKESQKRGAPQLRKVVYENLWDGITVMYEANHAGIAESTYMVNPGADVARIKIRYNAETEVQANGTLRFKQPTPKGSFTMTPPVSWQEKEGKKVPIEVAFTRHSDNTIGFKVGPYDRTSPLIIDPTYEWHTFYGSASADLALGIAIDSSGNVYVTGHSDATWGAPLHDHSGLAKNIFVMKLDNMGAYQWHTFFGSGADSGSNAIGIDNIGNIYVTGASVATWAGPSGQNPLHAHSGDTAGDLFVLKLDNNGAYQWHTFYGATESQAEAYSLAVHDNNFIVTTGRTYGTWNGPSGQIPLNPNTGGNYVSFVLKLDTSGAYQWHTFYGSDLMDFGYGITVDSNEKIYVSGLADGTWNGPSGESPLHAHSGLANNVFVMKLDGDGAYQWHTFYIAGWDDRSFKITVDSSGSVYATGTANTSWNGPTGQRPLHAFSGVTDLFVLKLNDNGEYQWHTFYGSPWYDYGGGIAVSGRNVYLTGLSQGSWNGPSGQSPLHPYTALDMFVLKLNHNGEYLWHTFYGSTDWDGGSSIGVTGDNNVYVAGYSNATWGTPINPYLGGSDIVVLKLADSIISLPQEGTIGTQITITGSGFGDKKGKVLIGGVATKIAIDGWKSDSITCTVTKVPPAGTHDVTIKPNKAADIPLSNAFTVKYPEIDSLDFYHGAIGDPIIITGNFFSTKKGKVYLGDQVSGKRKNCKVTSWGMDSITFVVPKTSKSFPAGIYFLDVVNKIGVAEASSEFTID